MRKATDDDRPGDVEYIRRRANVQLGDGPDQRGDVTVESFRRYDADALDRQFAEFHLELDRAVGSLCERLGLAPPAHERAVAEADIDEEHVRDINRESDAGEGEP